MERMQCQEKATNSVQELVRTPINRPKHMFTQDGMPWVIPTWCTRENPVLGKQLFFFFRAFFCLCFCALGMHPAFLKLKSLCLTFLAGIYFLRRMKLAGTNFLTPTVSRKAFFPLCYYASPHTMLNKLPRNICC
jgi:hypothetical protein